MLVVDCISDVAVTHAGFDLFQMKGQIQIAATIEVYGDNITTPLYTGSYAASSTPTFLGYVEATGIHRIMVKSTNVSYSPHFDDLTFGAPVPEPATFVTLGIGACGIGGVAALRRRLRNHRFR